MVVVVVLVSSSKNNNDNNKSLFSNEWADKIYEECQYPPEQEH